MAETISSATGQLYSTSTGANVGATSDVSVFTQIEMEEVQRAQAVKGLFQIIGGDYNTVTQQELEYQKMSNETNEVLVNLQNSVNSSNDPNTTAALPDDVVDFINNNEIVIAGVTDGGENGTFSKIQYGQGFNEGQLQAIKGQFDIMATSCSDSSSKYQLGVQIILQDLTQLITAISQTMSKENQVISQIISNFK